jgi:ankyrin repeat protein
MAMIRVLPGESAHVLTIIKALFSDNVLEQKKQVTLWIDTLAYIFDDPKQSINLIFNTSVGSPAQFVGALIFLYQQGLVVYQQPLMQAFFGCNYPFPETLKEGYKLLEEVKENISSDVEMERNITQLLKDSADISSGLRGMKRIALNGENGVLTSFPANDEVGLSDEHYDYDTLKKLHIFLGDNYLLDRLKDLFQKKMMAETDISHVWGDDFLSEFKMRDAVLKRYLQELGDDEVKTVFKTLLENEDDFIEIETNVFGMVRDYFSTQQWKGLYKNDFTWQVLLIEPEIALSLSKSELEALLTKPIGPDAVYHAIAIVSIYPLFSQYKREIQKNLFQTLVNYPKYNWPDMEALLLFMPDDETKALWCKEIEDVLYQTVLKKIPRNGSITPLEYDVIKADLKKEWPAIWFLSEHFQLGYHPLPADEAELAGMIIDTLYSANQNINILTLIKTVFVRKEGDDKKRDEKTELILQTTLFFSKTPGLQEKIISLLIEMNPTKYGKDNWTDISMEGSMMGLQALISMNETVLSLPQFFSPSLSDAKRYERHGLLNEKMKTEHGCDLLCYLSDLMTENYFKSYLAGMSSEMIFKVLSEEIVKDESLFFYLAKNGSDLLDWVWESLAIKEKEKMLAHKDSWRRTLIRVVFSDFNLFKKFYQQIPENKRLGMLLEEDDWGVSVFSLISLDENDRVNQFLYILNGLSTKDRETFLTCHDFGNDNFLSDILETDPISITDFISEYPNLFSGLETPPESLQALCWHQMSSKERINRLYKKQLESPSIAYHLTCVPTNLAFFLAMISKEEVSVLFLKKDSDGDSILNMATRHPDSLNILLSYMTNKIKKTLLYQENKDGETPLYFADKPDAINILLNLIPDLEKLDYLNHKDKKGRRVLDNALNRKSLFFKLLSCYPIDERINALRDLNKGERLKRLINKTDIISGLFEALPEEAAFQLMMIKVDKNEFLFESIKAKEAYASHTKTDLFKWFPKIIKVLHAFKEEHSCFSFFNAGGDMTGEAKRLRHEILSAKSESEVKNDLLCVLTSDSVKDNLKVVLLDAIGLGFNLEVRARIDVLRDNWDMPLEQLETQSLS